MADALSKVLEQGLGPLYLIEGPEAVLVDDLRQRLIDAIEPHCGPAAFNVSSFRCSEDSAVAAVTAARTLPMMAGRRLVVVRDLQHGSDAFFKELLEYVKAPNESTSLLLTGAGFPKVRKGGRAWGQLIRKAVRAQGHAIKLTAKDVSATRFAARHAQKLGHRLGPDEAKMLVGLVGEDLGQVAREVEKASLMAEPGAPITTREIQEACSLTAEAVVWDFTTALASRNAEKALSALHRLLEDGEAPHRLMGSVVWQLRTVLQVAELVRRGRSDEEIRSTLRIRTDLYFKIRRTLGRNFPGAAVLMEQLARANRAMNSSRVGTRRVIEHLVLELCRPS